LKKARQYNVQRKEDKNNLQKITQKTKDRVTRVPLKPVVKSGAPEGQVVPAPFVLKYFGVYDLTDIRFVRCISYDNN
jgi:hypothetical protein